MRVRLTTWRTGRGFTQRPGDVIELADDEAARLCAAGSAVYAGETPAPRETVEAAAIEPPRRRMTKAEARMSKEKPITNVQ